jgi:hypothetical protein
MSADRENWETTEDVEVSRPVDAVVSVRFPRDLADQLFGEAERRGVKTSVVVREAVEALLSGDVGSAAIIDVTVSSTDAPVTLYTGRSALVRTGSPPSTLVLSE